MSIVEEDPFAAPVPEEAAIAPAPEPVAEPTLLAGTSPAAAEPAPEPIVEPAIEGPAETDMSIVEEPAPEEPSVVDGLIDGAHLVPMTHPDHGTCDLYEEVDGKLMVPAIDVPTMLDHGFVVDA